MKILRVFLGCFLTDMSYFGVNILLICMILCFCGDFLWFNHNVVQLRTAYICVLHKKTVRNELFRPQMHINIPEGSFDLLYVSLLMR